MLQRAGRLLSADNAAKPWDAYKGRKLSIDAAGLLGYAVKRNSGEPLSTPTWYRSASIYPLLGRRITGVANGMPIEVRFSAINEPVGDDYAYDELPTGRELGTS